MNKELLARHREWKLTPTGKFEVTGFSAVDAAVAAKISDTFSRVSVTHADPARARFASFLARAPKDRVFVGQYDSVVEFLAALRRAAAGRGSVPEKVPVNRDALPLVNISRSFDLAYESNDYQRDRRDAGFIYCDDGVTPAAVLEITQATLTYNVSLIAAEKTTLGLMCNAFAGDLRFLSNTSFKAQEKIVNVMAEVDCCITEAKGTGFTDISPPLTENRIFAAQAMIMVMADVYLAWEVDAARIRVETVGNVLR